MFARILLLKALKVMNPVMISFNKYCVPWV